MLTVKLPVALITVGSPLAAMLATSAPAEAATLPAGGPPAPAFYLLAPASAVPPLAAPAYQPGQAVIVGSDAPPEVANPAPQAPQNVGFSLGASFYDGIGGGAQIVSTTNGNYLVLEGGVGAGPSVSFAAGPGVTAPSGASFQASTTISESLAGVKGKGSFAVNVPLEGGDDLGNISANLTLGVGPASATPGPSNLSNFRVSETYSYDNGLTSAGQFSGTNSLFDVTDQVKGVLRVPIQLPDGYTVSPPDANGVSVVTIPARRA